MSYNSMDCAIRQDKIIYVDSKTIFNILTRTKMAPVTTVLKPQALPIVNDLDKDVLFCIQSDVLNRKNINFFH